MTSNASRSVVKAVKAVAQPEGVGATVRRSIGSAQLRNLSPFLMLDQMVSFRDEKSGFHSHPHRGMSTVSYMTSGSFEHEDFAGNRGVLNAGDLQWMIAGRGIEHSEMPLFTKDGPMPSGLQLWIDLPAEKKMMEPAYYEHKASEIPTVTPSDGVSIKIIAGEAHGDKGKVVDNFDCLYLDVNFANPDGQSKVFQEIPEGWTAFFYTLTGAVSVNGKSYPPHTTVVLSSAAGETGVELGSAHKAGVAEPTRFILVAGKPLTGQRVVQHGPFVATSEEGIMQAFEDYRGYKNGFERSRGWKSNIGKRLEA